MVEKATGLISSLFDITSSQNVIFTNRSSYIASIMVGFFDP